MFENNSVKRIDTFFFRRNLKDELKKPHQTPEFYKSISRFRNALDKWQTNTLSEFLNAILSINSIK